MKKNSLMLSAKARIWFVLILIVLVSVGSFALYRYYKADHNSHTAASVAVSPDIASVPGSHGTSHQYATNVNQRNITSAKQAFNRARSSVPTPIRPTLQGPYTAFSPDILKTFRSKNLALLNPNSCSLKNLKLARAAGVTVNELVCQGCMCPSLRQAGYSAAELKDIGYTAARLKSCGYSLQQLVAAGFSAKDLKDAGFTAAQLKAAGFTAAQLKAAGFSAKALKAAGFTAAQLKAAGFTAAQLKAAGFSAAQLKAAGFSAKSSIQAKCDVNNLRKERMAGMTAKQLRAQGCGLAALKAAGFTAKELKDAGFTAAQLKAAGFSAKQLKDAGFTAAQLKAAGFNAAQLKAAGFTAAQLKAAGFSAKQLKNAGFTAAQLKAAGFTPAQLKAAGFSPGDLLRAGFSPVAAGYVSAHNCDIDSLRKARLAGVSAKQLKKAGCGIAALKAAGFTAAQLKAAGFTAAQLKAAGFTAAQLKAAGFNNQSLAGGDSSAIGQSASLVNANDQLNATASLPQVHDNSPNAQLAALAKLQEKRMTQQQIQNEIAQTQGAMMMQAGKVLSSWQSIPSQSVALAPVTTPVANATTANAAAANKPSGPIYKAGTITFAVIDTSINSDEKTPILATIVSGPMKGAKLIGGFTRAGVYSNKLEIQFKLLNDPHFQHTIPNLLCSNRSEYCAYGIIWTS